MIRLVNFLATGEKSLSYAALSNSAIHVLIRFWAVSSESFDQPPVFQFEIRSFDKRDQVRVPGPKMDQQ